MPAQPPGPGGTRVGLGIGLREQKDPLLRVGLRELQGPPWDRAPAFGVEWGFCKNLTQPTSFEILVGASWGWVAVTDTAAFVSLESF